MLNSQLNTKKILKDRYLVQEELGKKPGRTTFKALDRKTNKLVVVKTLLFSKDLEWHGFKLFKREAETLKALSHRAIPKYLDYFGLNFDRAEGFALVQNYIAARSLQEYLRSGRTFSESEVIEIGKQILEILIYLHSRQPAVVHRDIKPSNILLGDRTGHSVGKVYLVDFGSVYTTAASRKGTTTIVGTYGYMPPEQYRGRVTPKSDIYSLGATLIYAITGEHPSDLPQTDDLSIEFEQAANISTSFSNWLKKAIEPIPNDRFISARAAAIALNNSLNYSKKAKFGQHTTNKASLNKNRNSYKSPEQIEIEPNRSPSRRLIVNRNSNSLDVTVRGLESLEQKQSIFAELENNWILRPLLLFSSCWLIVFLLMLLLTEKIVSFSLLAALIIITSFLVYGERKIHLASQKAVRKKRLSLDREKIYCYLEKNQKIQHLIKVDSPKNISKIILGKKVIQSGENIKTVYFLSIRTANNKNYELFNSSGDFALSLKELGWLAKEISNILGIETSKIEIAEIDI